MNFLDKLERKFGKYAIPNLIRYILMGQAMVLLLSNLGIRSIAGFIAFDKSAVLSGEIWRLFTFIFIPDSWDLLWFFLFVIVYMSIGSSLENMIGSFKFNFYYFSSMIAVVIVAFIFDIPGSLAIYINLSLFLAFASLVPNATFLIYFIIPVKAKYMLVLYFLVLGVEVVNGGLLIFLFIMASLTGYILVIALPILKGRKLQIKGTPGQQAFRNAQRQGQGKRQTRRPEPGSSKEPIKVAFHKCHVCGKTELDDPEMEFRYCSQCNGHYEYCMDHLKNHEHKL